MNVEAIPIEIRESARVVLWNLELRDDEPTRVPYQPRYPDLHAAVDAPETWGAFGVALDAVREGKADGLGFVLGDGIVGVDLDECRDPESSAIEPWAMEIVRAIDSYTEISPSGTGLHVLARGTLPPGRRRKGRIELYSEKRYFTVTGDHLAGTPTEIRDRAEVLAALHARIFPPTRRTNGDARPESRSTNGFDRDDAALLDRARRAANGATFAQLWNGDASGYASQSEADLALCNLLAFWTRRDAAHMDRLFRRSGLMREKWDARRGESTYGVQTIARSVEDCTSTYGGQQVNDQPEGPGEASTQESDERLSEESEQSREQDEHFSDLGNARRFVADHGDDLLYVATHGHWYTWDDARFRRDETGEAIRCAQDTVRRMWQRAVDMEPGKARKATLAHAMASESEPAIRRMLVLARAQVEVAIESDALDAHHELLATPTGTIELSTTPILRPARREDLLTRSVAVGYDPTATAPTWQRFLERILPDAEVRAFVQRAVGYSLFGNASEQVILIPWGSGANGKSTFLEALVHSFGDYATNTPTETLLARRETSIPNDLAALRGVRLVTAVEAGEGRRLAEAKIKSLTGGDTISARFMRGEWFTFKPQFVVWLATNHRPEIRGTDHAIWRRIRLVPFTVTIPENEIDRELPARLQAEAAGILRWAAEGAAQWHQIGLAAPKAVIAATDNYRAEQDLLGAFLEENCVVGEHRWCASSELFRAWSQWCEAQGEHAGSQKRLADRLRERGFQPVKGTAGVRIWRGLGFLTRDGVADGG